MSMAEAQTGGRTGAGAALLLATSPPRGASGSSSRAALVLEALEERFSRVDVVSMSAPGDERRVDPAAHLIPWPPVQSRGAYATGLVRGGSPFVGLRASRLSQRLRELTERGQLSRAYDLVWSHFAITAPAGLSVPASCRVLDADFALGAAAQRIIGWPGARRLQRVYLRLDAAAITRREQGLCAMFDHIVVASELERHRLGHVGPPITVVPNAVPGPGTGLAPADLREGLLFVGSLDYDVNVAAVELLLREIFPRVRSQLPSAELTIVGRNPSDELVRLAEAPGVTLVPNAPSLDSFYSKARAVVAPLMSGGGTRIKVLEAMASSLPIVATPAGIEGLHLGHGSSALVATEPGQFAKQCIAVLEDAALADRLGRSAHSVWSREHRPSVAHAGFSQVVDSVMGVG
jgi:glycosyltransferase involved in cell wall biosynthesis